MSLGPDPRIGRLGLGPHSRETVRLLRVSRACSILNNYMALRDRSTTSNQCDVQLIGTGQLRPSFPLPPVAAWLPLGLDLDRG